MTLHCLDWGLSKSFNTIRLTLVFKAIDIVDIGSKIHAQNNYYSLKQ